jgi:DNA replication ATP-dependent helicase Dna2
MVGNLLHPKLPPLVKSKEAIIEGDISSYFADISGMEESLFKRLSEAHPSSVVQLETQYRMSKDIMLLSNTLIYNGSSSPCFFDSEVRYLRSHRYRFSS